jgi:hypothetical protein
MTLSVAGRANAFSLLPGTKDCKRKSDKIRNAFFFEVGIST